RWVVGRPQFEEVRQSGEAPRQGFIAEREQLSPMWPRLVGRQRGLDGGQQGHDLGWMLAPGEADAQAVALVGGAEPQVVGGGGPDLGGVQMRRDAVTKGAKGPQGVDGMAPLDEVLGLELVPAGRWRRIQA